MRITMNMAVSKQKHKTEIGTLQFRKTNEWWEVLNHTTGEVTGCINLEPLVELINDQIAVERSAQALGFRNAPKNYARKVRR